jgi:hypothetical protein
LPFTWRRQHPYKLLVESKNAATPPQRNMFAGWRCANYWALKIPSMDRSAPTQKGSKDRDGNQAPDQPVVTHLQEECCVLRRQRAEDGRDGAFAKRPHRWGSPVGPLMTEPGGAPVLPSINPRIQIGISNAAFYVSELRNADAPMWCGGRLHHDRLFAATTAGRRVVSGDREGGSVVRYRGEEERG